MRHPRCEQLRPTTTWRRLRSRLRRRSSSGRLSRGRHYLCLCSRTPAALRCELHRPTMVAGRGARARHRLGPCSVRDLRAPRGRIVSSAGRAVRALWWPCHTISVAGGVLCRRRGGRCARESGDDRGAEEGADTGLNGEQFGPCTQIQSLQVGPSARQM
jgi:hypothetical protein